MTISDRRTGGLEIRPFEIMVGAILTQNTNWSNVQKAIDNLKSADLLSYQSLSLLRVDEIAQLIRPAGYYNLKARRLRNLLDMVATHLRWRIGFIS